MHYITKPLFILSLLIGFTACQPNETTTESKAAAKTEAQRIVSLSGFLTEVLYELGYGEQIVGRDVTSAYPAAAKSIPDLGHISQLNAEAILALQPDVIFLEKSQQQQTTVLQQLENADLQIVSIPTSFHLNNAVLAARKMATYLDVDESEIVAMAQRIEQDSLQLVEQRAQYTTQPKVLFIYARGAGRLMVGGTNTSAAAMIEKGGGQNAIQSFEDFRALSPEALLEAAPDVILMFETGLASLDGKEGLAQITGIPQTPAFQNDRIVAMDGHLLTAFGPQAGQAALELADRIHEVEVQ